MFAKILGILILIVIIAIFVQDCHKTEIPEKHQLGLFSGWTEDDFEEYKKLNQATIDAVNKMNSASKR